MASALAWTCRAGASTWTRGRCTVSVACVRSPCLAMRPAAVIERIASRRRAMHWVLGAYLLGALLQLGQVPLWVIAMACGGAVWALAAAYGRARLPGRLFKVSLTLALTGTVLAIFH